MKKILILIAYAVSVITYSQTFQLTPDNFKQVESQEDYIIIDFPQKNKEELFNKTKEFVNSYYNNPKFVTSESEKDQIVINAFGEKYNMTMFNWNNEYQIEILFKNEKIKITPKFKWIKNFNGGADVSLNMGNGQLWAVFNKKGKVMRSKAKETAENDINSFLQNLKVKINKSNDW